MKSNLTEKEITQADAKEVMKYAASLKKNKLTLNDLQKAWADARYPDDTADLYAILKDHGFNDKTINGIFAKVFGGTEDKPEEPAASGAIQKIADYAKEHDLVEPLKAFLEKEYGEELELKKPGLFKRFFGKKAVHEEIRDIFTFIVNEERTERVNLIKQLEHTNLGRTRK